MKPYHYLPLDPTNNEIRLIKLLPGRLDDPIQVEILHERLLAQIFQTPEQRHLLKNRFQKDLPRQWKMVETLEGRLLFFNEQGLPTWTLPGLLLNSDNRDFPEDNSGLKKECTPFEALSYVWGALDASRTVVVRNAKNGGQLEHIAIGRNLEDALRYLRYRETARIIWIDALCIDQANVLERNEQVRRMGDIYRMAWRVVAWIGPGFADCHVAFNALKWLGNQIEVEVNRKSMFLRPGYTAAYVIHPGEPLPFDQDTVHAIKRFTTQPWWDRLWVLQEIQLGIDHAIVKCGEHELDVGRLRCALFCILTKETEVSIPRGLAARTKMLDRMLRGCQGILFGDLLWESHSREVSDKRDTIYGILSLAPSKVAMGLKVDYSKSEAEVYLDAFMIHLQQFQRLELLKYCGGSLSQSEHPTWCPNWSLKTIPKTVPSGLGFAASGASASSTTFIPPGTLQAAGLLLGRIELRKELGIKDAAGLQLHLFGLDARKMEELRYPCGGTILEAYIYALTKGQLYDRVKLRYYRALKEWMSYAMLDQSHTADISRTFGARYISELLSSLRNTCIVTTNLGHIGSASSVCQPGDYVAIVLGCDTPIILREVPSNQYKVVCDCYLHGFMDGEAILGELKSAWRIEIEKEETRKTWTPRYFSTETALECYSDPRLIEIPFTQGWEPLKGVQTNDDPIICTSFRHRESGEVINYDPRLTPEALKCRGISIKTLTII
ncbi:HET domain containing protein [Hyaloscypha variabilis]